MGKKFFQGLNAIDTLFIRIFTVLATILCILMAGGIITGVLFRFVLNTPLEWSEELPKYCMVWMTFLGAPVVLHHGGHIALASWHGILPQRPRLLLQALISFACCFLLFFFIYYGWRSAVAASGQRIILLNNLSMFWFYLSVPLGSAVFFFSSLLKGLGQLYQALAPQP